MSTFKDVEQEPESTRVFYAVRTLWPRLPYTRWAEITLRIMTNPEPGDFCQCCGNDCCNSRKCRKAIAARNKKR